MIIWGNHSPTMYPDSENVQILGELGSSVINDVNWVESDFIPKVQQRGKAVIDARGASSATSAAKAATGALKTTTGASKSKSSASKSKTGTSKSFNNGSRTRFGVVR